MLIKGLINTHDAIDLNMHLQNHLELFSYPWRTREALKKLINDIENGDEKYKNDCLFSFVDGNEFLGWVKLHIDEKEKFGKIDFLSLKEYRANCLEELVDYIDNNYSGYMFDFGLPMENQIMNMKMQELGFRVLDANIDNRITIGIEKHINKGIEILKSEDFDMYAIHHDQVYGSDMYWNSMRLKEEFDRFIILVMRKDNQIKDSLFMMTQGKDEYEIMGITETDDEEIMTDLVEAAMSLLKENDKLVCFTDAYSELENSIIQKLGFTKNSSYILLRKKI